MPWANPPLDEVIDSPDADSCPMPTPSGVCTPSYAESCVMQGLPREEKHKEIIIEKSWEGKDCTDGVWEHPTRGHGVTDEDDEQDADHVPAAMVLRVISACSREIGVENGKYKERTIT